VVVAAVTDGERLQKVFSVTRDLCYDF
jgi:hypothetical protein